MRKELLFSKSEIKSMISEYYHTTHGINTPSVSIKKDIVRKYLDNSRNDSGTKELADYHTTCSFQLKGYIGGELHVIDVPLEAILEVVKHYYENQDRKIISVEFDTNVESGIFTNRVIPKFNGVRAEIEYREKIYAK